MPLFAAAAARIGTCFAGSARAIAFPAQLLVARCHLTGWTVMKATVRERARFPASRADANAQVAQLVEHATENRSVGGSIPPLGTILQT